MKANSIFRNRGAKRWDILRAEAAEAKDLGKNNSFDEEIFCQSSEALQKEECGDAQDIIDTIRAAAAVNDNSRDLQKDSNRQAAEFLRQQNNNFLSIFASTSDSSIISKSLTSEQCLYEHFF